MPTVWPARPCKTCGDPFTPARHNQLYCSTPCRPSRHRWPTPTSKERGLGIEHQRNRARDLPKAYGTPCDACGNLMLPGQALDYDHETPRSMGGTQATRFRHASCNRSMGDGTKHAPLVAQRRTHPPATHRSRDW